MSSAHKLCSPPPRMPDPIDRARRAGPIRERISVEIETTTPILGGAPATRSIDDIDIIRVPTIRGHLRFWWRALQSGSDMTPEALYAAESRLWGKAADENGGRSAVETLVEIQRQGTDGEAKIDQNARDAYALWPARATAAGELAAHIRHAGVRFRLTIIMPQNDADVLAVRNAIRAWILFGGYGSRTRRGLGSVTVRGTERDKAAWLPSVDEECDVGGELISSLRDLFRADIFEVGPNPAQYPRLNGAALLVGRTLARNHQDAWETSIGWLREFRQGRGLARDPGTARPGQSRWPEADKLRHLSPGHYGHPARYADHTPAWPRAAFGLPIVGRFQGRGEPPDFLLTWQDATGKVKERMASPLIVKALPTMQGFRPCALWLARSNPPGMKVIAQWTDRGGRTTHAGSAADPGYTGSAADQSDARRLNAPLTLRTSVQESFLDWVKTTYKAVQVTP